MPIHSFDYKRLVENLETAILLMDADLRLSYLNPAAEALLGISALQVLREPVSELLSEDGKALTGLESALESGMPYTKRQTKLRLPIRQDITVDYTVTPLGQDSLIMEIQPLDRLLSISQEETLLSSQQTSQLLVRGLAHEIKNPLGGLRGAAQLLAMELPSDDLRDYTNIIIEEADRLSKLVDQLLGPYKALERKLLNIHEIIERVYDLLKAETQGSLHLLRDYDPSIPEFMGDKEQLIQAILNIARNAMQSLEGQSDGTITLRTRSQRQFTLGTKRHKLVCRVEIIDNGPGIPGPIVEQIFFPMVSGRAEGHGLGLSIAQSIISQHQGLIKCESETGNTKFSLYMPLESVNDQAK